MVIMQQRKNLKYKWILLIGDGQIFQCHTSTLSCATTYYKSLQLCRYEKNTQTHQTASKNPKLKSTKQAFARFTQFASMTLNEKFNTNHFARVTSLWIKVQRDIHKFSLRGKAQTGATHYVTYVRKAIWTGLPTLRQI